MFEDPVGIGAGAVQLHPTSVVAWDIPPAVVAGERFRMKVGVKCASACPLAHVPFAVYDDGGARVAAGTLGGEPWPGTAALYAAEIELTAPAAEGLHTWSVRGPDAEAAAPHAVGSTTFGLRVVNRADHLVTVEAVDKDGQTPIAGARVVMHPYHVETDERGVATLRVAKGTYRLFVSQTRYETFALPLEVEGDLTTRAELSLEPILERN